MKKKNNKKNNSGRGAATEKETGERTPVGRPMVFRQRAGKFVEHFLGIRSFSSPFIFLTSEERTWLWMAMEPEERGLDTLE